MVKLNKDVFQPISQGYHQVQAVHASRTHPSVRSQMWGLVFFSFLYFFIFYFLLLISVWWYGKLFEIKCFRKRFQFPTQSVKPRVVYGARSPPLWDTKKFFSQSDARWSVWSYHSKTVLRPSCRRVCSGLERQRDECQTRRNDVIGPSCCFCPGPHWRASSLLIS